MRRNISHKSKNQREPKKQPRKEPKHLHLRRSTPPPPPHNTKHFPTIAASEWRNKKINTHIDMLPNQRSNENKWPHNEIPSYIFYDINFNKQIKYLCDIHNWINWMVAKKIILKLEWCSFNSKWIEVQCFPIVDFFFSSICAHWKRHSLKGILFIIWLLLLLLSLFWLFHLFMESIKSHSEFNEHEHPMSLQEWNTIFQCDNNS